MFAAAVIILGSAALGYVALASFAIQQLVWVSSLLLIAGLLLTIVNDLIGREVSAKGFWAARRAGVGRQRPVIDQIGVLVTGALQLIVFVFRPSDPCALGIDGADLFSTAAGGVLRLHHWRRKRSRSRRSQRRSGFSSSASS